jgi:hypothetical protein
MQKASQVFNYAYKAFRGAISVFFAFGVLLFVINAMLVAIDTDRPKQHTDTIKQSQDIIYSTLNDPKHQETQAGRLTVMVYRQSLCALIGEACTNNPADAKANFHNSIYGMASGLITMPYTSPPASGVFWVQNTLQNAGFVPEAYAAQGIGFSSLQPLMSIWTLFRNISIALIVIAILLLGFMIIFRLKINPQTVVTMQNSVPRIFVTLLLITFSFAIAGFMIDAMYVASGVAVGLLGGHVAPGQQAPYMNQERQLLLVTQSGIWRVFDEVFWNSHIISLGADLLSTAPLAIELVIRAIPSIAVIVALKNFGPAAKILDGMIAENGIITGVPAVLVSLVAWLILFFFLPWAAPYILGIIILVIAGLAVFVRIILLVIKTYIRILINVLLAPIILLPNIIPGRNDFSKWIKALAADLAVFPTIMVMFMLSGMIAMIPVENGAFWTPPFLSSALNPGSFRMILSIGILFLTPNIVKSLRGIMGVQDSSLGFGPGIFLGGLAGAGIGGIGRSALSHTAATKIGGMFDKDSWLRRGLSRARKKPLPGETEAVNDFTNGVG